MEKCKKKSIRQCIMLSFVHAIAIVTTSTYSHVLFAITVSDREFIVILPTPYVD
jgi:hypothetical protein